MHICQPLGYGKAHAYNGTMQPIRITPSCGCKTRGLGIAPVRPDIADFPVAVLVGGGFLLFAMVAAFALTSHEPSRPF